MRRGISPLVSGILLLTFSLFIGIIILTWASESPTTPKKTICDNVRIQWLTIENQPLTCTSPESLTLGLENTGEQPISEIIIQLVSATKATTTTYPITLKPGYATLETLDLDTIQTKSIKVVPVSEETTCAQMGITLYPIRTCT